LIWLIEYWAEARRSREGAERKGKGGSNAKEKLAFRNENSNPTKCRHTLRICEMIQMQIKINLNSKIGILVSI